MIRYRCKGAGLTQESAALCDAPIITDLRRHGPWRAVEEAGSGVVLEQVVPGWKAEGWGPWLPGLPGREYSLATNQPPLSRLRRKRIADLDCVAVEISGEETILIPPAINDGFSYGLRREDPPRPASSYNRTFFALLDRTDAGEKPDWAEWKDAIVLAIQAGHRLTVEAIRERDLIPTSASKAYLEAMASGPKAEPASAGSGSAPPGSTGGDAPAPKNSNSSATPTTA